MRCLHCDTDNPDGAKFCIECGSALRNPCPNCGGENVAGAKFCMECGTSLAQSSNPNPTPKPAPTHWPSVSALEQAALEARGAV